MELTSEEKSAVMKLFSRNIENGMVSYVRGISEDIEEKISELIEPYEKGMLQLTVEGSALSGFYVMLKCTILGFSEFEKMLQNALFDDVRELYKQKIGVFKKILGEDAIFYCKINYKNEVSVKVTGLEMNSSLSGMREFLSEDVLGRFGDWQLKKAFAQDELYETKIEIEMSNIMEKIAEELIGGLLRTVETRIEKKLKAYLLIRKDEIWNFPEVEAITKEAQERALLKVYENKIYNKRLDDDGSFSNQNYF